MRHFGKDVAMRQGLFFLACLMFSGVVAQTTIDAQDESETLWSLRTLRTPIVPSTESSWSRTPLDAFALQKLLKGGLGLDEIFRKLGKEGGLLGLSGVSPDMRDVEKAAAEGNARAKLAVDAFVESVRSFIGQYLVVLSGVDVLAFTGGIGENGAAIREAICKGMDWAGVSLDLTKNQVRGREEKISRLESGAQIWIVPTNEELIVARQTVAVLSAN